MPVYSPGMARALKMLRFGIDLGGTKIEIIALDGHGQELYRRRAPTPQGDYRGTLLAIATLVRDAESALDARGTVGIPEPQPKPAALTVAALLLVTYAAGLGLGWLGCRRKGARR